MIEYTSMDSGCPANLPCLSLENQTAVGSLLPVLAPVIQATLWPS